MSETTMQLRGGTVAGDVIAVDDSGEAQTITVQTHEGVVRSGIPVLSIHGFASNPSDGAIAVLVAIGGDEGNLVALPLGLPSARFGNLPSGGAALHDDAGNRLVFPADGSGLLTVAALMRMVVQTLRIEAQAAMQVVAPSQFTGDMLITGNLHVTGNLQVDGSIHANGGITHG